MENDGKAKFLANLKLANQVMINHLPLPDPAIVFDGARLTLRRSLEVIYGELREVEPDSELEGALNELTILCAVIEHHLIMARICSKGWKRPGA